MTGFYVSGEHCRLKSYGATTRGSKTILKVEFEISEPYELAHLLRELAEFGQRGEKPIPPAKKQLLLPAPGDDR